MIAAAVSIAVSLLAQPQSQSPKRGTPPAESSSAAVAAASMVRSPRDVPDSTQLVLPGCSTTPASRLVGRWTSIDPSTSAISCHYFSPIDEQNGSGVFVTYRLEALDQRTGARSPILPGTGQPPQTVSWERVQLEYRVLNQDAQGDWVTVEVHFANDTDKRETHYIPCNGLSDSRIGPPRQADRRVDDMDVACSEGDDHWKDNFSRFIAVPPPAAPAAPRTGREVRYQVDGTGHASLTYRNASGGTDQITVKLPWSLTFIGQPRQFVYLSAQNTEDWGKIVSIIYLDDTPVQTAFSNSPYGIASVSGTIPAVR